MIYKRLTAQGSYRWQMCIRDRSYVVILGIYYKLQTFLYLPASGIVQGMRPVIGYNYGAGEHKRCLLYTSQNSSSDLPDIFCRHSYGKGKSGKHKTCRNIF